MKTAEAQADVRNRANIAHNNVLVVEDSPPERARIVAILTKQHYKVFEASDGMEALEMLRKQLIHILISDWRMPRMNGLQLCAHIQNEFSTPPYLILVTGQDSMCDLVAGMDAGADDFIRKPFDSEELRVRLKAGQRIVDMREALKSKNLELKQALTNETKLNKAIQLDLKAAEKLQCQLLPASGSPIPGVRLAHYFKAAKGVAGDAFDVIPLTDNDFAFYQIDVAGHGVRSAMLSFTISHALKDPGTRHSLCWKKNAKDQCELASPAEVVTKLNQRFQSSEDSQDYFTMVYGIINTLTGRGRLCQAGHPHPLLISTNFNEPQQLGSGGLPVGLFSHSKYRNTEFVLKPGERLLVLSDGIFECSLKGGREIDYTILNSLMRKMIKMPMDEVQETLQKIIKDLKTHEDNEDDISLMLLERDAAHGANK